MNLANAGASGAKRPGMLDVAALAVAVQRAVRKLRGQQGRCVPADAAGTVAAMPGHQHRPLPSVGVVQRPSSRTSPARRPRVRRERVADVDALAAQRIVLDGDATGASGPALTDVPGTGARGSLTSGALESSNVDIGNELVTLIAYQQEFQANSKTVTTADQMLQTVDQLQQ